VPYPICGKCGSKFVYSDRDEMGARVICCLMCGNRMPGTGKGFYMSDKPNLKEIQTISEETLNTGKQNISPTDRICSLCKTKKTISPKHDLCGSCLAAKGKEKRNKIPSKVARVTEQAIKDKGTEKKTAYIENMSIKIDFTKYPGILNQIQCLADEQVRPVDAQIIYLLKNHLSTLETC